MVRVSGGVEAALIGALAWLRGLDAPKELASDGAVARSFNDGEGCFVPAPSLLIGGHDGRGCGGHPEPPSATASRWCFWGGVILEVSVRPLPRLTMRGFGAVQRLKGGNERFRIQSQITGYATHCGAHKHSFCQSVDVAGLQGFQLFVPHVKGVGQLVKG